MHIVEEGAPEVDRWCEIDHSHIGTFPCRTFDSADTLGAILDKGLLVATTTVLDDCGL